MATERKTIKYELRTGNKVEYVGITDRPAEREAEHRAEGMNFGKLVQIGNRTTREAAGRWEESRIQTYKQNHGGQRPRYNQNDSGK